MDISRGYSISILINNKNERRSRRTRSIKLQSTDSLVVTKEQNIIHSSRTTTSSTSAVMWHHQLFSGSSAMLMNE